MLPAILFNNASLRDILDFIANVCERTGRHLHARWRSDSGLHAVGQRQRIEVALARAADTTGAAGTGLLAAVLFDAVAPESVVLTLSGSATGPGGAPMGLQFRPVTVTVRQ